jgi:hypothetical protein
MFEKTLTQIFGPPSMLNCQDRLRPTLNCLIFKVSILRADDCSARFIFELKTKNGSREEKHLPACSKFH